MLSSLSNAVWSFTRSMHAGGGSHFIMIDDILSLVIFTGFSVIQAQLLSRFRRLKRKTSTKHSTISDCIFREAHTLLGTGHLVCAVLSLGLFCMKTGLVGQHTIPVEYRSRCPKDYAPFDELWEGVCLEEKWHTLLDVIVVFDYILGGLFQAVLFISDGLMLHRCYASLQRVWSRLLLAASLLRILSFLSYTPRTLRDGLPATYISFLTTLFTSFTLILSTALTKRSPLALDDNDSNNEFGGDDDSRGLVLGHKHIPSRRFMGLIVKCVVPITLVGALHIGLFAGLQITPVALNWVFFSLTVLVPQRIALQVYEHAETVPHDNSSSGHSIPLPISLAGDEERLMVPKNSELVPA